VEQQHPASDQQWHAQRSEVAIQTSVGISRDMFFQVLNASFITSSSSWNHIHPDPGGET